jgi:hypothetical protein
MNPWQEIMLQVTVAAIATGTLALLLRFFAP